MHLLIHHTLTEHFLQARPTLCAMVGRQTLKQTLVWGRVSDTDSGLRKSILHLGNSKHTARVKQVWKRYKRISVEPNSIESSNQSKRSYQNSLPVYRFQVDSTALDSDIHFFPPWQVGNPQASPSPPWGSVFSSTKWPGWLSCLRLLVASTSETAHTST